MRNYPYKLVIHETVTLTFIVHLFQLITIQVLCVDNEI